MTMQVTVTAQGKRRQTMDYRDDRMKEYQNMLREIEGAVPAELEGVFERAAAREKKHRRAMKVIKLLASMAAVFVCFVLSVNFITPVAQACSKIPVLKELAAAVNFSGSLSRAVANDYVQSIGLSETKNGIRADIDYVIVERKQLNIFYRLEYSKDDLAVFNFTLEIDPYFTTQGRNLVA